MAQEELKEIFESLFFKFEGIEPEEDTIPSLLYWVEAYKDNALREMLNELEKRSIHYTADGLVADGLDSWAIPIKTIQAKRKTLNKESKDEHERN